MFEVVSNFNLPGLLYLLGRIMLIALITTSIIVVPYYLYKKSKSIKIDKFLYKCLFIFYIISLLIVTIYRFGDTISYHTINLKPFVNVIDAYRCSIIDNPSQALPTLIYNVMGNIIWFIPMGFLLPILNNKCNFRYTMIIGFLTSLWIEIVQYLLVVGISDIDDLIFNCLGCAFGYMIYIIINRMKGYNYEY